MGKTSRDEKRARKWYDQRTAMMVDVLGQEHDMVMHAIVPFALGGDLHLYYFPSGIEGTGIATKDLSEFPGEGPRNRVYDNYELVMFTRHPVDLERADDDSTPFGRAHSSIRAILNVIARYSAEATLNPGETAEFPADMEVVGGKCLLFDAYGLNRKREKFGLLSVIEVHPAELEFARQHGGAALIARLKDASYYPYSDLDRPSLA